ncbi:MULTISPECIES: bacteriocin immunity protein [Pseudomonas]|uniref:bacteriocin immunity protein n=1 Tax=Pseudomonas TaxID=286 RepID=UPI001F526793|nr:bacteriocin immunity protein [Pseudomonas putida]MCI0912717.1 bacteriocin immunity protein [Pseudomonas putida]WAB98957.1 bacteriocin immunity protein [Pseudomonas putida]
MSLKTNYHDYTELEFIEFLKEIYRANTEEPDDVLDPLLEHFSAITEHPSGTDLIYWPENDEQGEPEAVLNIIKTWRAANGKPGFKDN